MPSDKPFSQFVKDAIGEFMREAQEAGLTYRLQVPHGVVFGQEVAKLAAFGTEEHVGAYRELADFLRRYGAMADDEHLGVAAVVADAAAALIEKSLAGEAGSEVHDG